MQSIVVAEQMAESPLTGLRVLELARILAGPWGGAGLADLGADVVKVESPAGDDTRKWGPPWGGGTPTAAGTPRITIRAIAANVR